MAELVAGAPCEYRFHSRWIPGKVAAVLEDGRRRSFVIETQRGEILPEPYPPVYVRSVRSPKRVTVHHVRNDRGPLRDDGYLAFVRTQPCMDCQAPAPNDPHHFGPRGMSQKTDDYRTVPFCRRCHDLWHDTPRTPERDALLYRTQVDLLVRWLRLRREA